ncbi:deaminated glutathione amidase [Polypterus senegalus]
MLLYISRCCFRKVHSTTFHLKDIQKSVLRMSSSLMTTGSCNPIAAVCQVTSTADKNVNFSLCQQLVQQAQKDGACMVFLPEAFDYIGTNREETLQLSETLEGDTIQRYSQMARDLGIWVSLGGFHERGHAWETDRRIYNSHVIISSEGTIMAVYRKCHLFDVELPEKKVSLRESAFTIPGPKILEPLETPIGKLGLAICYDVRFPELSLALMRQGAEILTYPSAFTLATGTAHWEVLLRARAIETQTFVIAAAQVGRHNSSRTSYGHSLIVDPWGDIIGRCGGDKPGFALAEIDLNKLRRVRTDMPVQKHRRENELYSNDWKQYL